MNCVGCGDSHIVIKSHSPLCRRCAENTTTGGELGDWEDEQRLLLQQDLQTPEGPPETWTLEEVLPLLMMGTNTLERV